MILFNTVDCALLITGEHADITREAVAASLSMDGVSDQERVAAEDVLNQLSGETPFVAGCSRCGTLPVLCEHWVEIDESMNDTIET